MTDRPDDEILLSRFGRWLQEARDEAEASGPDRDGPTPEAGGPEVGLYRLVEEFTALRHEVKLQTKGTRGLQEQAEALLPALSRAIEQFRAVEPKEAQAAWTVGRPLAEALADLDEALDRGRLEIEKARHPLVTAPVRALEAALVEQHARRSWLGRHWFRSSHEQALAIVRRPECWMRPDLFDALLEGYGLIQGRLRRVMDAEQIRRIEGPGRPVDPERMTVVEVVDTPDLEPGHVVDELRRGYTWRGRLLRFAEVRAARMPAPSTSGPTAPDPSP